MNEYSVVFENLPSEIIEKIFGYDVLSFVDLGRLSCVSQSLNFIARSNNLWRKKFALAYSSCALLFDPITTDWKSELQRRQESRKLIVKKLRELSVEFYYTENVSNDQFLTFRDVCADHRFGVQIIIDELWQILTDADCYHNLTLKYYAQRALRYMQHTYLQRVWHDFLEGDKKSLLKGACLVSQWCQPTNVPCTDLVSENINDLVKLVYEEVRKACPHHPVLKQNPPLVINDCAQVLENSVWEPHLCKVILEAINEVMFNKLNFCGNADILTRPENNYIDNVLISRSGNPTTLCIIYATVAAQLGVLCLPVSFPGHFLLKWLEHPHLACAEAFTFIDVYDCGIFKSAEKLTDLTAGYERLSESWFESISPIKVYATLVSSLAEIARQQDADGKGLVNLCNALELLSILTPTNTERKLLLVRSYMQLRVNISRVISILQEMTESGQDPVGVVSYFYRSAITLLETQRYRAQVRKLKCQPRNGINGVEFAVGMVMKHKKYNYRCVIYGWDVTCTASKDWITSMGVYELKYKDQQPFYLVFVDDGTNRYAAQENLEYDYVMQPISHPEVGHYFDSFHGTYYIPNEQKSQEYPDDNLARDLALNANLCTQCQAIGKD